MVETVQDLETLCAVVREWVASLPEGEASLSEEDCEYEYVLRVQPANPRSSRLALRIGKYDGQFDAAVGRGIQFDDMVATTPRVLSILDAVQNGRVEETVLVVRESVARSHGSMKVGEQTWHSNRTNLPFLLLAVIAGARSEAIRYEPFEATKSTS